MNDGACILVGDIGGTNVRFALARASQRRVVISDLWKRPGAEFASFSAAIAAYRRHAAAPFDGAAFGVAGPVEAGSAQLLHRDWFIDGATIASELGIARCVVVNDFVAMARAAPELSGDALVEIAPGQASPHGSIAVGGPGTGFGLAVLRCLIPQTEPGLDGWVVIGGEGGHQSFAPQTDLEWRVAENLRGVLGYVSNETIAAGAGFDATLAALADAMGVARANISPGEVEAGAVAGDPLALAMCRLRAQTAMTALGDAALSANTTGGVFIAGGVAVKLARYLKEKGALARFRQRGARTALLSKIPIKLILSEEAPLLGAAHLWLDDRARGWL